MKINKNVDSKLIKMLKSKVSTDIIDQQQILINVEDYKNFKLPVDIKYIDQLLQKDQNGQTLTEKQRDIMMLHLIQITMQDGQTSQQIIQHKIKSLSISNLIKQMQKDGQIETYFNEKGELMVGLKDGEMKFGDIK